MHTWCVPSKDSDASHQDMYKGLGEALVGVGQRSTAHSVPPSSFSRPWIYDLAAKIENVRILVYTHGQPAEDSTIDSLSTNLLRTIFEEQGRIVRPLANLFTSNLLMSHKESSQEASVLHMP